MITKVIVLSLTVMSVFAFQTASADSNVCSSDVKQVIKNSKWQLDIDFNNSPNSWTVTTDIAADGAMTAVSDGVSMKIRCNGKRIIFDWKNNSIKQYNFTLGKDGNFSGVRSSNSGRQYDSTLKKI